MQPPQRWKTEWNFTVTSSIIGSILPASYLAYFSIKNISLGGSQAHTRPRWKRSMFNEHNERRFSSKSSGAKSRSFQIISHNLFFNLMFFASCPSSSSISNTLLLLLENKQHQAKRKAFFRVKSRLLYWKFLMTKRNFSSTKFVETIKLFVSFRRSLKQNKRISQRREIEIYIDGSRTLFQRGTGDGIVELRCCVDWSELLTAYEDLRSNASPSFTALLSHSSADSTIQGLSDEIYRFLPSKKPKSFQRILIHPHSQSLLWTRLNITVSHTPLFESKLYWITPFSSFSLKSKVNSVAKADRNKCLMYY